MKILKVLILLIFTTTYSWSQTGFSGDFEVSEKNQIYHFTLVNGSLVDPVSLYTIQEDQNYISGMYLSDSILLSGIDSMMIMHKKDSLLKQFTSNFEGTYAGYNKKGRMTVAMHLTKPLNQNTAFYSRFEDLRMNFYPNGKPYALFYVKNGRPSKRVIYFTRDGEVDNTIDLSQYVKGEEVLIQNPWDFRMRKKMLSVLIE